MSQHDINKHAKQKEMQKKKKKAQCVILFKFVLEPRKLISNKADEWLPGIRSVGN